MPGARTHWHRHPLSQTVFVTEGIGVCQRRGGPIEVIRPGDRVLFEADADHDVVHWLDPVTNEQYEAAPPIT
jgi:quercetin dioxygenase-like cupin family protein